MVRHLARDNLEVNDAWLCDKGRFAFQFADQPNRLATPLLRERGLEPVSFEEALSAIASWSAGHARAAFLAGGRLSDEDAYALSKLARTVFHTNDVDHRWTGWDPGALEAERAMASGMPVSYDDWLRIEQAEMELATSLGRGARVKLASREEIEAACRPPRG